MARALLFFVYTPMEKPPVKKATDGSSFFNLLSDAEAIQVREVTSRNAQGILTSIERAVQDFDDEPLHSPGHTKDQERAFLVHIKAPNPPAPEIEAVLGEAPATRTHVLHCAAVLLESGDALLARNLFSFLLKENDRDVLALKGLGQCFLKLSDTLAAKKCFQALWDMHSLPDALVWLGAAYVADKKDDIALELFNRITDPETLSPAERFEWHKELGNCHTRRNHLKEAEEQYQKAIAIQPNSDIVQVNLGTLEIQRKAWDTASQRFHRAISLNPKNAKAYCGLGLVALSKNDLPGSLRYFTTTLDLDSQNVVALFQLLTLSHLTNNFLGLKNRLARYLIAEPRNHEVRYALASILFKEGNWTEAEKEIDLVLQSEPSHQRSQKLKQELISNRHRS